MVHEVASLYTSADRQCARLRAAHVGSVVRLTPWAMACNLGSGGLVLAAFGPAPPAALWAWWSILACVAVLALANWRTRRRRPVVTASPRALHRATAHAACLAAIWALVPLIWFPHATAVQQLTVATLLAGMLGAGTFLLHPLPLASAVYCAIFLLACLGGLALATTPGFGTVAALLCLYGPMTLIGALAAWRKANALLLAQARSARQERVLAVLLDDFEQHAGEALWEINVDGRISHASPRLWEMLGISEAEGSSARFLDLLARVSSDGSDRLARRLRDHPFFRNVALEIRRDGAPLHLSINGKRVEDEDGHLLGWRGVVADITHAVESERKLRHLAHNDSLTGLANRAALRDALESALRSGANCALLSIDLDRFKAVNDTHGHSAGDAVLREVAVRLRHCVRTGDLLARLGGDEFAVVLPGVPDDAAAHALARRMVEALQPPIDIDGRRFHIGLSVGIAMSGGEPIGIDELLVRADAAMYAVKEAGRGGCLAYCPTMGERNRRRALIEKGLREAVESGQLQLHWQPRTDVEAWRITGAEGLMRWTHPVLGRVNPAEFIGIAEQEGLIESLGRWALREACRAATTALGDLVVSVNVSPLQLRSGRLPDDVRDALREFALPASRLELEITESVLIDEGNGVLDQLHALRALGIRIALDDFGTGYSSLAYLRRFPFDTLKIDRAFISEVLTRKDALAIVHMIVQLAGTLGMRTVSEGVETAQQLAAISAAGCDEIQGYFVSAPRPLDDFVAWRRQWRMAAPDAAGQRHDRLRSALAA